MDREAIESRVDELREANPGRTEFIAAIKEFGETLTPEDREVLGQEADGQSGENRRDDARTRH